MQQKVFENDYDLTSAILEVIDRSNRDLVEITEKIVDSVADEIERLIIENDDIYLSDMIFNEIDYDVIYTSDQWAIMQYYQNPQGANYLEAMELFKNDIAVILGKRLNEMGAEYYE